MARSRQQKTRASAAAHNNYGVNCIAGVAITPSLSVKIFGTDALHHYQSIIVAICVAFCVMQRCRDIRQRSQTALIVAGGTPAATVQNMCGIVGYVGRAKATPILLDGLRRLEYRGYDSAGIAVVEKGRLETRKCAGRIAALTKLVRKQPVSGSLGVSHTRWATHGKVTDENAHPHFDASGKLALVHNGVIENYQALKDELIRNGDTNFAPRPTPKSSRI